MLSLALFIAAGLQQPAPPLPVNTEANFRRRFDEAVRDTSLGNFDHAAKVAAGFPKRTINLSWDKSTIPAPERDEMDRAVEIAVNAWAGPNALKVSTSTKFDSSSTDIQVAFVSALPKGPQGMPASWEDNHLPDGKLLVRVSLTRGNPGEPLAPSDFCAAVAHALGDYLGVADDPLQGTAMHRDDRPDLRLQLPAPSQIRISTLNLTAVDRLDESITKHVALVSQVPTASLEPKTVDLGSIRQGTKPIVKLQLSNLGAGKLTYQIAPDCGCFSPMAPGVLDAGKSATLISEVDTSFYIGTQHKTLALYTNDPNLPAQEIPVTFRSLPAYRIYRPDGDHVDSSNRSSADVYLLLPSDSKIFPQRFQWSGTPAKVSMNPFEGPLADPEMSEPAMQRKGFVFRVTPGGALPNGQSQGSLIIETGDPTFPRITYNLYFQKGILALPNSLFFGALMGPARQSFLISRPNNPFHIKEVIVGSRSLKAVVVRGRNDSEYQVDVLYDGTAEPGDFMSVVQVKTDDPKQPSLSVTVHGVVR